MIALRSRLVLGISLLAILSGCGSQATAHRGARNQASSSPSSIASQGQATAATPTATQLACRLPVYQGATNTQLGGFINLPSGQFQADPSFSAADFAYDWAVNRWLTGAEMGPLSRDGRRLAQGVTGGIQVVDLQTNRARSYPTGSNGDDPLYFAAEGVYFTRYATPGAGNQGLWLLDPNSGRIQMILSDSGVVAVGGFAAWLSAFNHADSNPFSTPVGTLPDEAIRHDLNKNDTRVWFYQPGANVVLNGFSADRQPIFTVETHIGNRTMDSLWIVPQANAGVKIFSEEAGHGQIVADSHGVWISGNQGIYLWRDGALTKVSNFIGIVAGTCKDLT